MGQESSRDDDISGRLDGPGSGVLADPRVEDTRIARATAVRKCHGCGAISGAPPEGCAGSLSGSRVSSGSQACKAPDAKVRRYAGFRYERWSKRCATVLRQEPDIPTGC